MLPHLLKGEITTMKKIILAGVAAILLATTGFVYAQQGSARVIAIAATGKTFSDSVANQAGRSDFFLIVDKQGALVEAVENPYKDAGNAGISMVDFLAGKGANIIVAEGFGPRIVGVMKDKGIRAVEFKGSARDAVRKALDLK